MHFGIGAFHRAHQAVYTEAAAARSGEPWGIAAVAPGSAAAVDRAPGPGLPVLRHRPGRRRPPTTRVVGSDHRGTAAAARRRGRATTCCARPAVSVVTLTVTEKGYHRRADNGALDTAAPAIAADLARTADTRRGATIWAPWSDGWPPSLAGRFRAGGAPISVVSCDNMAGNGAALAGVIRGFVQATALGRQGRRARLDGDRGRLPGHRGGPDRARPPPTPTGTPRPPRSACGTRWPWSASPTGNGCCRTPSPRRGRRGNSTARCSSPTSLPTS